VPLPTRHHLPGPVLLLGLEPFFRRGAAQRWRCTVLRCTERSGGLCSPRLQRRETTVSGPMRLHIRPWFQSLMQPDHRRLSCCGEADALWRISTVIRLAAATPAARAAQHEASVRVTPENRFGTIFVTERFVIRTGLFCSAQDQVAAIGASITSYIPSELARLVRRDGDVSHG
jgi:hypothetical protein